MQPEISEELNESFKSLREESSELMSKIELFTIERREVLDKLDAQQKEELSTKVVDLNEHRTKLQDEINQLIKQSVDSSTPQGSSPAKSAEAAM